MMQEAKQAGLSSGFSIPIHGALGEFGALSLASPEKLSAQSNKIIEAIPHAVLIISAVQEALKKVAQGESPATIQLTKRESECLTWAAEGKSAWEVSQILGCAERTIIFHLTNAALKLGSTNRYQAISKAILSGAISPAF